MDNQSPASASRGKTDINFTIVSEIYHFVYITEARKWYYFTAEADWANNLKEMN